jgi:hypothetical protein
MLVLIWFTACCLPVQPDQAAIRPADQISAFAVLEAVKVNAAALLDLRNGVTREQVRRILGEPTFEHSLAGHCSLVYCNYHLQFWFENDCPRKMIETEWMGKKESAFAWAANPAFYKYRLVKVQLCRL